MWYDQPVPAPVIRPVLVVPLDRQNQAAPIYRDPPAPVTCHAARTVRHVHTALVHDYAASTFCFDHPTLPPFTFCPMLVPLIPSPTPLLFLLCPTPALSASIPARVQPLSVKPTQHAAMPVSRDSCKFSLNAGHGLVEIPKQEAGYLLYCHKEEEDVAVQKEEGRGKQQAVGQLNDDENEKHCVIKQQQELETQQKIISQRLNKDEHREIGDEDQTGRIADEDRMETEHTIDEDHTRSADEDLQEIEHHQEVEHSQENKIDMLPAPILVSPPVPEPSPGCPAKPDI